MQAGGGYLLVLGDNNNNFPSLASNTSWRGYLLVLDNDNDKSPSLASNASRRGLSSGSRQQQR
jgi:hypothetical protein